MNRRGFLGSILALGAAPAIVRADSLMRIVPREALVIAPAEIRLALSIDEFSERYIEPARNMLMTIDQITREALRIAHDKAVFIGGPDRQYDPIFSEFGAKSGSTIRIRKPNRYTRSA